MHVFVIILKIFYMENVLVKQDVVNMLLPVCISWSIFLIQAQRKFQMIKHVLTYCKNNIFLKKSEIKRHSCSRI